MKNNNKFYEVNCAINRGERLVLHLPISTKDDFDKTISDSDGQMNKLIELVAEFSELDNAKRMTFQALIEEKADKLTTLDDLLYLLKTVRICTAFFDNN